jgi:diguanylate cyclase (GGDEF)-like protein
MTRRAKAEQASGYTVLLVDDNPDYLQATRLLLEREGHNVLTATNGPEALSVLPQQKVDLLLLDYFMPGMTGEQVVTEVRKFDPFVQVILQTGYASEQPPRELLHRLNIQGYYDKTEGPEQLLLWTAVGLKAAYTFRLVFRARRGIEFILERTPDLHRLQPMAELAREILQQASTLLAEIAGVANVTGFLATLDAEAELIIRAGTGAFASEGRARELVDAERLAATFSALEEAEVQIGALGTIVPLRAGPLTVGVIYLDQPIVGDQALALVRMLGNQAAVALQNAQLYEVAAVDLLTETRTRSFFEQALARELAASHRAGNAVAVVIIDVDKLKSINQRAGHVAGDQVLRALGRILRQVTRAGDVVGRVDNDAFGVVLRDPLVVGPARLASRVRDALKDVTIPAPDGEIPIHVSIGFTVVEPRGPTEDPPKRPTPTYFADVATTVFTSATAALTEAQSAGGNTARGSQPVAWP